MFALYVFAATVMQVHDGDTLTVDLDLGFSVRTVQHLRLLGCNAIELGQPGGHEAKANLEQLVLGRTVVVRTVKPDKFGGRYDAAVTLPDGRDLVPLLIADDWAVAWDGTGPKPVPPWPRP